MSELMNLRASELEKDSQIFNPSLSGMSSHTTKPSYDCNCLMITLLGFDFILCFPEEVNDDYMECGDCHTIVCKLSIYPSYGGINI